MTRKKPDAKRGRPPATEKTARIQIRGSLSPAAARELGVFLLQASFCDATGREVARLLAPLYDRKVLPP